MTGTQVIAMARSHADDSTVPYKWTDSELVDYLNMALNDIYRLIGVKVDATTTAIVDITIAASTFDYALDSRITEILEAKVDGTTTFLKATTTEYLNAINSDWRSASSTDSVQYYCLDYRSGYITLYPPYDDDGTLSLRVKRFQATPFTTSNLGINAFEINTVYQAELYYGILEHAFLKSGDRTYIPEKSVVYGAKFRQLKEDIARDYIKLKNSERILVAGPHRGTV